MNALHGIDQIISFSRDGLGWLFTWSCQIMLLLAGAFAAVRLDRSRTALIRYRIWLIALIASAALPILGAICERLPGPVIPASLPLITISPPLPGQPPATPLIGPSWPALVWPVLFAFWAAGALLSLARLARSCWTLRRIKLAAEPVGRPPIADLDPAPSGTVHQNRPRLPILLSKDIQCPGLAGFLHPVVLLPADMDSWTSAEERTSILRHELAHISRRDHLASLFQAVLKALLFFHPMVRYASNQLSLERELACDDRVLGLGTEPRAYAESILKAAERALITDVVHQPASFASKRKLERRIDMILDTNRA